MYRLALSAHHLITAAACLRNTDLVLPGGEGAEDLASSTLLKFLDPHDSSVTWSAGRGEPTTAGVFAYLREVLRKDFLDLLRSKRTRTTVYVDAQDSHEGEPGFEELACIDIIDEHTPEVQAVEHQRLHWLMSQFQDEPKLRQLIELQCEDDGYNGFTNQELARILETSVSEIENRKKRLKLRLKKIAAMCAGREA